MAGGGEVKESYRKADGDLLEERFEDCGTGAGGFKPGNTCASGGEGEKVFVVAAWHKTMDTTKKDPRGGFGQKKEVLKSEIIKAKTKEEAIKKARDSFGSMTYGRHWYQAEETDEKESEKKRQKVVERISKEEPNKLKWRVIEEEYQKRKIDKKEE
jgi:hypothetical protein